MTPDQLDRLQLALANMVLLDDGEDPITLGQLQAENAKYPTEAAEQRAKVVKLTAVILDNLHDGIDPEQLAVDSLPEQRRGFYVGMPKGVKITHMSGAVVICDTERSQHLNRDKAMRAMRALLHDH